MLRLIGGCAIAIAATSVGCGSDDSQSSKPPLTDAGIDVEDAGADRPPDATTKCGNGVVEGSEQCDDGPSNGAGKGCELDCTPSCSSSTSCDDGEACNGAESCAPKRTGQACTSGTPLSEGSPCGTTGYCKAGKCTEPVCGNGAVEPGEACDPPGTGGCSAKCQICGDGLIGGDEQCDDGNLVSLDGCDSSCHYEMIMRMQDMSVSTTPAPAFCVHQANAFASALSKEVLDLLAKNLNDATEGGANNMLIAFNGLDDLTGTNDATLSFAMLSGLLDQRYKSQWTPNAIDAWIVTSPDDFDAASKPTQLLGPGKIASNVLDIGPGDVRIRAVLGTTSNDLFSRDTTIRALVDTTPAPDQPAPPPDKLAAGLSVFRSLTATASDQGLCSNLTVDSLSKTNIPGDFAIGPNACQASCSDSHSYVFCGAGQPVGPTCNSMLDVLVGGCKITVLCIPAAKPTQPDVGSNGNAPAPITLGAYNKSIITSPTDAYSVQLHFKAQRAHVTNNLP